VAPIANPVEHRKAVVVVGHRFAINQE
jgi:hypothetical protein